MPENKPETEKKDFHRTPAVPARIKNLNEGRGDMQRVSIIGTIVSKNTELYSFVLDDGETSVLVLTNNIDEFEKLSEGQFVRVMGKIWGEKEEIEIQAEVVQDFSKINKELYKKVFN